MTKRYAILNGSTVDNIAIADEPMLDTWIDLTGITPEPSYGWVYEGGVFVAPADPIALLPVAVKSVTMRQAQLALLSAGLYDSIMPAINAIVDPIERQAAQIEWATAKDVLRDSPLIQKIQLALNKSDTEIDALFEIAASK